MARHHAHAVYTTCNLPQQPNSNWLEVRHQRRQRNVHAKHDATLMPSLITRRRVMSDTGQQLTSRQATTMEPWPAAAAASNSRNPFVHKGPAACTLYNTPTGGFTCSNAHDPCNTHTHTRASCHCETLPLNFEVHIMHRNSMRASRASSRHTHRQHTGMQTDNCSVGAPPSHCLRSLCYQTHIQQLGAVLVLGEGRHCLPCAWARAGMLRAHAPC